MTPPIDKNGNPVSSLPCERCATVTAERDTARAVLAALRAAAKVLVTLSESMRLLGDEFDECFEYKQAEAALKALAKNGGET